MSDMIMIVIITNGNLTNKPHHNSTGTTVMTPHYLKRENREGLRRHQGLCRQKPTVISY